MKEEATASAGGSPMEYFLPWRHAVANLEATWAVDGHNKKEPWMK